MTASSDGGVLYGRGSEILGVSWMLMAVTTIAVMLRLYVRVLSTQNGCSLADDWSLILGIVAWLLGITATSLLSVAVHYGLGSYLNSLLCDSDYGQLLLYTYVWLSLNTLMTIMAKFSVAAQFLVVRELEVKALKPSLAILMGISACVSIVEFVLIWVQCKPSRRLWEPATPGNCNMKQTFDGFSVFAGSWSAFVNMCLAIIPLYVICHQHIQVKVKMCLLLLIALGMITCVCACMSTYEISILQRSSDRIYDSMPFLLWSSAESCSILVIATVLPIWPLLSVGLKCTELQTKVTSAVEDLEKENWEVTNRVSARSYATTSTNYTVATNTTTATNATTATNVTTTTDGLTLNSSTAGQDLDGMIAVKREVTVDREARRRSQGFRPRADTRSWAKADTEGLARWDSNRGGASPNWARRPSWTRRPSLARAGSSGLIRWGSATAFSSTWARKPSLPQDEQ